ncbi:MAG TPA: type II toxin-antitoxin system RelE/ParE family toxin [Terriglobia bacterium]
MPYRIEIAPAAERQIRKLEARVRRRIVDKLESLSTNPRPAGVKKLAGSDFYRVRVGDYRIIYDIQNEVTTVLVLKVGDRKDIYQR